jgi:formylglycine-generating enzyme required for sulfatase activity
MGIRRRVAARRSANQPRSGSAAKFPRRGNYDWRYAYLGSPKAQARRRTVPIERPEPNPFGLLHVHGNVSEWVEDC